ncbi:MAG: FTR1 family protein [Actinomycetota bacterium]|nr:MAG: FTR1 family protein [Actinomycetota bacterium]
MTYAYPNFLIGLREGLEASLVVGILVAYLVRTGNRRKLPWVWAGIGLALVLSLSFGALLTFTSRSLTFEAQEAFGGVLSIIAVGFVTWMVFWMRRASRQLKGELQGQLAAALDAGAFALALVAFLAVGREGLETALFLWTNTQAAGTSSGTGPIIGAILGLLVAVVLGWLIYRGALKLNLAVFFRWTGALLILIAAGVLSYGVHDLQEAGILPGLNSLAFDVSSAVPPSSWYGTLLKGIFNFSPATTWLELVAWVGYLVPVMVLYFRPYRPAAPATPNPRAESHSPASA